MPPTIPLELSSGNWKDVWNVHASWLIHTFPMHYSILIILKTISDYFPLWWLFLTQVANFPTDGSTTCKVRLFWTCLALLLCCGGCWVQWDMRNHLSTLGQKLGWIVESDGQTPWEGAQVVALEVLLEICQDYGDELINGPAGSFPRASVTDTFVSQIGTEPLEMRETILGYSSSPTMSAMLAVLKL